MKKKAFSLLLALAMVLALAACGSGDTKDDASTPPVDTEPTSTLEPEETPEAEETPEPEPEAEQIAVGGTISTDFVEMTVDEFSIKDDIKTSIKTGNVTRTSGPDPQAGTQFVYIRGTIKNLSTSAISYVNMLGNVTIDGYSYETDLHIIEGDGSLAYGLDPLISYAYTIYASVPNELTESYQSCEMTLGFCDLFEGGSYEFATGDLSVCPYVYTITMDASAAPEAAPAVDAETIDAALQGTWTITGGSFDFNAGALTVTFADGSVISGTYTIDTDNAQITGELTATDGISTIALPYDYTDGTLALYNNAGQALTKQ